MALPVWTWAVLLGATVNWRGQEFRIRSDMTVVAAEGQRGYSSTTAKNTAPTTGKID